MGTIRINEDVFDHTATARNGDWTCDSGKDLERDGPDEGGASRVLLPLTGPQPISPPYRQPAPRTASRLLFPITLYFGGRSRSFMRDAVSAC